MIHCVLIRSSSRRRLGFTLIELLLVVALIALLIGILIPVLGRTKLAARMAESMVSIDKQIDSQTTYAAQNKGRYLDLRKHTHGDCESSGGLDAGHSIFKITRCAVGQLNDIDLTRQSLAGIVDAPFSENSQYWPGQLKDYPPNGGGPGGLRCISGGEPRPIFMDYVHHSSFSSIYEGGWLDLGPNMKKLENELSGNQPLFPQSLDDPAATSNALVSELVRGNGEYTVEFGSGAALPWGGKTKSNKNALDLISAKMHTGYTDGSVELNTIDRSHRQFLQLVEGGARVGLYWFSELD